MTRRLRTWCLLRVSTAEQTVEAQRVGVQTWAKAHGVQITRWIVEEGVSGAAMSRPKLDQLVADARAGNVDRVVVSELSRLGRSMPRIVTTMATLDECGVTLLSVKEGLDSSTPMGKAMLYMAGIFAELERDRLRQRTREGVAAARFRGRRLGRPSIAWTSEARSLIRSMRASGRPWTEVAAALPPLNYTNGKPWTPNEATVRREFREVTG